MPRRCRGTNCTNFTQLITGNCPEVKFQRRVGLTGRPPGHLRQPGSQHRARSNSSPARNGSTWLAACAVGAGAHPVSVSVAPLGVRRNAPSTSDLLGWPGMTKMTLAKRSQSNWPFGAWNLTT